MKQRGTMNETAVIEKSDYEIGSSSDTEQRAQQQRPAPLALELENIRVRYGRHDVLKDVNLEVEKGEFLGIIGPNGGGKTTLLKAILGIIKPTSGSIRIFGHSPSQAHHLIGYVPQYSSFDECFPISVWDVVLMGRLGKLGRKPFFSREDRKIAMDALRKVGMEDFGKRQITRLSGGQQQRVLIARALAMEPRILLLDEPTASVDKRMENSIYELLKELNETTTMILVTHDIGVLSAHVKKIGCLNKYFIYHGTKELTGEMLEAAYQCPVDLIAHGIPHRVFQHGMHDHDLVGNESENEDEKKCGKKSGNDSGKRCGNESEKEDVKESKKEDEVGREHK